MKHKLLTNKIKARFNKIGEQQDQDPLIITKFFNPCGSGTWYASEYFPEDNTCFGYVTGLGKDEWGRFSIAELEAIRCPRLGLPIERDQYFTETRFSELKQ